MDSEFAISCAASTTVEDSIDTFESNKSNSCRKISSIHAHCHLPREDEPKIGKDSHILYYCTTCDYLSQVINNMKCHLLQEHEIEVTLSTSKSGKACTTGI